MFSPRTPGGGGGPHCPAWPGPVTTHGPVAARLSECEELWLWAESETVSWGQIGDTSVPSSMRTWGGALCLLWWASVSINRSLRDKVWWELLKSPSVNPWDVFLVVISLRISSIYYCFSIEHSNCHSVDDDTSFSRSGWHYSRITQSSDSSPGNTSSGVITLQQPSSGHSHVPECLRLPTLKWTLNSE